MRVLLIALFLLLQVATAAARDDAAWDIGPYRVTVGHDKSDPRWGETVLTVFRDGHRIHEMKNISLHVNPISFFVELPRGVDYEETIRSYEIGRDVLRLGAPTLVVQGFSGGAHCCFDLTVLVLGETFEAMPTIPLFDAEFVDIRPVPNRGPLTIKIGEFPFAEVWRWGTRLQSPYASVVLSYDATARRYVADPELMRKPLPPSETLADWLFHASNTHQTLLDTTDDRSEPPGLITGILLDLIYTGHLLEAREFLANAWADTPERRDEYWADMMTCWLRLGRFWPAVAAMNGIPADPPVAPCPRPRAK